MVKKHIKKHKFFGDELPFRVFTRPLMRTTSNSFQTVSQNQLVLTKGAYVVTWSANVTSHGFSELRLDVGSNSDTYYVDTDLVGPIHNCMSNRIYNLNGFVNVSLKCRQIGEGDVSIETSDIRIVKAW